MSLSEVAHNSDGVELPTLPGNPLLVRGSLRIIDTTVGIVPEVAARPKFTVEHARALLEKYSSKVNRYELCLPLEQCFPEIENDVARAVAEMEDYLKPSRLHVSSHFYRQICHKEGHANIRDATRFFASNLANDFVDEVINSPRSTNYEGCLRQLSKAQLLLRPKDVPAALNKCELPADVLELYREKFATSGFDIERVFKDLLWRSHYASRVLPIFKHFNIPFDESTIKSATVNLIRLSRCTSFHPEIETLAAFCHRGDLHLRDLLPKDWTFLDGFGFFDNADCPNESERLGAYPYRDIREYLSNAPASSPEIKTSFSELPEPLRRAVIDSLLLADDIPNLRALKSACTDLKLTASPDVIAHAVEKDLSDDECGLSDKSVTKHLNDVLSFSDRDFHLSELHTKALLVRYLGSRLSHPTSLRLSDLEIKIGLPSLTDAELYIYAYRYHPAVIERVSKTTNDSDDRSIFVQAIAPGILSRVGHEVSLQAWIELIENFTNSTGIRVCIDQSLFLGALGRLADQVSKWDEPKLSIEALSLLIWFELYTGEKPTIECQELVRRKLYYVDFPVGYTDRASEWVLFKKYYGENIAARLKLDKLLPQESKYSFLISVIESGPAVMSWFNRHYGKMLPETAHKLCGELLFKAHSIGGFYESISKIARATGVSLDFSQMESGYAEIEGARKQYIPISPKPLSEKMRQALYTCLFGSFNHSHLAEWRAIEKIESLLNLRFSLDAQEAQLCYAAILPMARRLHQFSSENHPWSRVGKNIAEGCEFIEARTGQLPANNICQLTYLSCLQMPDVNADYLDDVQAILKVPIEEETIANAQKAIIEEFINYTPNEPIQQLARIANALGRDIRPTCVNCDEIITRILSHGPERYSKINIFCETLGLPLPQELIVKKALKSTSFNRDIKVTVADAILDAHFSDPERITFDECVRVYRVFRPREYYDRALAIARKDSSVQGVTRQIAILTAIACGEKDPLRYSEAKRELESFTSSPVPVVRKTCAYAFCYLYAYGEYYFPRDHAKVLRKFVNQNRKRLSFEERYSFRLLSLINCWEGSNALLTVALANNTPLVYRQHALKTLVLREGFFPSGIKAGLNRMLNSDDPISVEVLNSFEGLGYFSAIRSIRNTNMADKSNESFDKAFELVAERNLKPNEIHQSYGPQIPADTFIQLAALVDWDISLIEKFNHWYGQNTGTMFRSDLQFGIISAARIDPKVQARIRVILKNEPEDSQTPIRVMKFLRRVAYLASGLSIYIENDNNVLYSKEVRLAVASDTIDKCAAELDGLEVRAFSTMNTEKFSTRKLLMFKEEMGTLDPVLILASRYHQKTGLADCNVEFRDAIHHGFGKRWKPYRYNREDPEIASQIGLLDEPVLPFWTRDHIAVAKSNGEIIDNHAISNLATVIRNALKDNNARNCESPRTLSALDHIRSAVVQVESNKPSSNTTFTRAYLQVASDAEKLGILLSSYDIEETKGALNSLIESGIIPINSKTRQRIDRVFRYQWMLSSDQHPISRFRALDKAGKKFFTIADIAESSTLLELLRSMQSHSERKNEVLKDNLFCVRYGIRDREVLDIQQLLELKQTLDLARDLILITKTQESEAKDDSEEDSVGITRKLLIDLARRVSQGELGNNITEALSKTKSVPTNLAVCFTDHPWVMMQIGKYPATSGSCMNYEGIASRLAATTSNMIDAHIKALLLLDVDRLPVGARDALSQGNSEKALSLIHPQTLLNASTARKIVRLGHTETDDKHPVVYLEPTYPLILDRDPTTSQTFERYTKRNISDPIGAFLFEEASIGDPANIHVRIPASRTRNGQHEDHPPENGRRYPRGMVQGSYSLRAGPVKERQKIVETRPDAADIVIPTLVSKEMPAALVGKRSLEVGFRLTSLFDLEIAYFDADSKVDHIRRAESVKNVDVIYVNSPTALQTSELLRAGYWYAPSHVGYRLSIPSDVTDETELILKYTQRCSGGSDRRRAFRRINERIAVGELSLVYDLGESSGADMLSFLELYRREMLSKPRGRVPLIDDFRSSGGDPVKYIKHNRIGVFLKRGDAVIGGLIAYKDKQGYSISYAATDSSERKTITKMQQFINSLLVIRSWKEGFETLRYGRDANLYGHHLSAGLLLQKTSDDFVPYQMGSNRRLIKIVDWSKFSSPTALFSVGTSNELELNLIVDGASETQISEFEGIVSIIKCFRRTGSCIQQI